MGKENYITVPILSPALCSPCCGWLSSAKCRKSHRGTSSRLKSRQRSVSNVPVLETCQRRTAPRARLQLRSHPSTIRADEPTIVPNQQLERGRRPTCETHLERLGVDPSVSHSGNSSDSVPKSSLSPSILLLTTALNTPSHSLAAFSYRLATCSNASRNRVFSRGRRPYSSNSMSDTLSTSTSLRSQRDPSPVRKLVAGLVAPGWSTCWTSRARMMRGRDRVGRAGRS